MTFVGGTDNVCVALGAGLLTPETGLVSIETSGVLLKSQSKFIDHQGKLHLFLHTVDKYQRIYEFYRKIYS